MAPFARILIRTAIAWSLLLAAAPPASAQTRRVAPPPSPDFLTRADFHLGATALVADDPRFSWDTHWGGELDLVDFVRWRVTFFADYQAVLGDELQPFDPNQGNYTLAVSSAARVGAADVAVVFNHVSRHLGDRPKTFGIAWNVLGVRYLQDVRLEGADITVRADGGSVIQQAYVDYRWYAGGDVKFVHAVNSRLAAYVRVNGELYGVDPAVAGRTTQQGGGVEGGVRLGGRGGTLELFAGYARVIDADPIDRRPQRWGLAGFRLLSR